MAVDLMHRLTWCLNRNSVNTTVAEQLMQVGFQLLVTATSALSKIIYFFIVQMSSNDKTKKKYHFPSQV